MTQARLRRISIDNGLTLLEADEVPAYWLAQNWDLVVSVMDDDTREAVHAEGVTTRRGFLQRYLELADSDLIIG